MIVVIKIIWKCFCAILLSHFILDVVPSFRESAVRKNRCDGIKQSNPLTCVENAKMNYQAADAIAINLTVLFMNFKHSPNRAL